MMTRAAILCLFSFSLTSLADGADVFGEPWRIGGVEGRAMAVDAEGGWIYVAAGTKLSVFDVSDPLQPKKTGELEGVDNRRQLVVRNGIVYLVSRETGLRIVDCTDPAKPRLRSRFDSVEFATGVEVVGSTAFLSERINGVEIVDVSDPDRPAHVLIRKTPESQSCRYCNGYLYSGEWGAGEVTVFDVRDLGVVKEVGRLDLHGFGDGLDVHNGFLYCSTGHDAKHGTLVGEAAIGCGRGLDVFALDDPAHPRHVGRVDFPCFKPRNDDYWTVRVAGSWAFCADSHNGLFAVDVSDPPHPRVSDRLCFPDREHPNWPSSAISSIAVGHGCLYVTVATGGLYVVPVAGLEPPSRDRGVAPKNVRHRETYPTDAREFTVYRPAASGQARTAIIRGDVVYAAFGDAGLHVLRVGADGGFVKLGELRGRKVYDCGFSGDRLLTAEGVDGFALYELDGPMGFREVARRPRLSADEGVAFWTWTYPNGLSVVTGRNGPLRFLRTDDLASGGELATFWYSCQWDKYPCDRPLGGRLPVIRPGREIVWLDISGKKPVEVRRDAAVAPRQTNGICAFDDKTFFVTVRQTYVFIGTDGVLKAPPQALPGNWRFGGMPRSDGRLVALTARSAKRAALFDFSDRDNPKQLKDWRLSGNPDAAAFCRGRVLIPAGHQGLLIAK